VPNVLNVLLSEAVRLLVQLDRTHVTIRVRTLSEIGDLALLMIRRYPHAFFHAFFLGAFAWIVANAILLGWLPAAFLGEGVFESDAVFEQYRYVFWMITLVFLQTPIAGALTTYSLGQSIFEKQPTLRKTIRDVRAMFWPLVWVLGVKRLAIPAMLVVALRWDQPASGFFDVFVPICFMLLAALVRSSRPFVGEMIVLERCPIRGKTEHVITLKRRSKALHSPMASELGGRFLTISMTLFVLLACLFFSMVWLRGLLFGVWAPDALAMHVFFPLSLWLIASFSVVVKLLNYLDARIRLEGWEVELAIRAEAIRQFGEDAMDVPVRPNTPTPVATPAAPLPTAPASASAGPGANAPGAASVITNVLLLLGFLIALSIGGTAVADSPAIDDTPVVADSVWFDSDTRSLRPIELEDSRVDSENRDSRWLPKPEKPAAKAAPAAAKPAVTSWYSGITIWNVIGWFFLLLLIGALVAMLVYLFANSAFEFRPDLVNSAAVQHHSLDEQTKQRIAKLPAELRDTNVNPRAELERLMNAGDFDRAIIFLYGHQLLLLDRIGWLRLSRWKTNNQYVRETRQSHTDVGDQLGQTARAFEQSYFGKHSITAEMFEPLWQDNLRIEQIISNGGTATA